MTVTEDRLAELQKIKLLKGKHGANDDYEMCVMEAVAYVAGEPWSDHPKCASPVLTAFCMNWNDSMSDEDRQKLTPFVPRLVGTASGSKLESRRAWMATDWLVRVHTPTWLDLAGLTEQAAALRGLPELVQAKQVPSIKPVLEACRRDAAAAWAAAGAAARAAAGDAAWDAARAAAGDAAWAAAGAAARAAAGDAAWAAAGAAAGAALRPTVVELQASALELLDRMIEAPA